MRIPRFVSSAVVNCSGTDAPRGAGREPVMLRHPPADRPRPWFRSCRRRAGAAAMEFAVVVLIFFTLILALFELGRGLMTDYLLVNAARQACRVGILPTSTSTSITDAANAALARGQITGATVTVQVNGVTKDVSAAQSGDRVTVLITVPIDNISWVPLTRYLKGNLSGQYTLRRE